MFGPFSIHVAHGHTTHVLYVHTCVHPHTQIENEETLEDSHFTSMFSVTVNRCLTFTYIYLDILYPALCPVKPVYHIHIFSEIQIIKS